MYLGSCGALLLKEGKRGVTDQMCCAGRRASLVGVSAINLVDTEINGM